ncbi:PREDICTED: zinc finger protein 771-like [Dinoponera quadriceps]|uniref:Zinc finger protein 771-like n=1 Tax=Dinoponera quadriceps TaxID=609295 RepID=A0A6P3XXP2_DINQU|nr:PREDICTED: zinc finger protein 771-like [Dinoponera quadriceps]
MVYATACCFIGFAAVSIVRKETATQRLFCDRLPRDVWKVCKDNLQCLKCEKRYSDWRSLRKHMNYFCHMEPLFPCPYCSHKARLSTLLKYSVIIVDSDTCFGLGAVTKSEDLLVEHSGKSLFVCPKCGKGYSWKACLQRHLTTVCGTPPMLSCSFCGYESSRKDVLFRHMRLVHPRSQVHGGSKYKRQRT